MTTGGEIRSNVISSQGVPRPVRRRRTRGSRLATIWSGSTMSSPTPLATAEVELPDIETGRRHARVPVLVAAPARRVSRAPKATGGRPRAATGARRSPPRPHRRVICRRRGGSKPPFVSLNRVGRAPRSWPACTTAGPTTRCSVRRFDDARRRGVRQGRSAARARVSGRGRRWSGSPARVIPTRSGSRPGRAVRGLDFSFAGLKTALLYKVARAGRGRIDPGAAADLARVLPARDRRGRLCARG